MKDLNLLGRDSRHFAKTIIREILSLPFFDRLQNQAGDEFRLVAISVIGCWSSAGRISHPVRAKVRGRNEWVDLTYNNAVFFQLGARRQTDTKKRAL